MGPRFLAAAVALAASWAFACSLAVGLPGEERITSMDEVPVLDDSGTDTEPPAQVKVTSLTIKLGTAGCGTDGLFFSIAEPEEEGLRYVASTGESADSAEPSLLFSLERHEDVFIYLGSGKRRDGSGFSREKLCFTLAAVDAAGNVGESSTARCVNTVTGEGADETEGCASAPWLLAPLGVLLARRRHGRHGSRVSRSKSS